MNVEFIIKRFNKMEEEQTSSSQMINSNTPLLSNSQVVDSNTPLLSNSNNKAYDGSIQESQGEEVKIHPIYLILRYVEVLVLLVLLLLISTPPFIAQIVINKTQMQIINTKIYDARNDSFKVDIKAKLISPMAVNSFVYPSKMIVKYKDKQIGMIHLPKLNIKDKVNYLDIKDTFTILDQQEMSQFSIDLIQQQELEWSVQGKIDVNVFGMKLKSLDLNQNMKLLGMKGLKQIDIKNIDLPNNHELGGIKIIAKTNLFNPSNNQLSLGSVKYGMFYKDLLISEMYAKDLNLMEGDNQLVLDGRLIKQNSPMKLNLVSKFVTKFIKGDNIPILIKGLDLEPDINWLLSAIKHHQVNLNFTNQDVRQFVKDIDILNMATNFEQPNSYKPVIASQISATLDTPFKFPFNVIQIKENLNMFKNNKFMAKLNIPFTKAKTIRENDQIRVLNEFENIKLDVNENNKLLFEQFIEEMVYLDKSTVHVIGNVDTVVNTDIGNLNLNGIELDINMNFPGMKGMKDPPPKLTDLDVIGTNYNKILFKSQIVLDNPTNFSGYLGDVQLLIYYQQIKVGQVKLLQFSLKQNNKTFITAIGFFELPNCIDTYCYKHVDLIKQDFLSKYINGEDVMVDSLGYSSTTDKQSLLPALSKLNYSMVVPKIPQELLKQSQFKIFSSAVILNMINPFNNVTIKITQLNALAYYHNNLTAKIQLDFLSDDIKLNPTKLEPIKIPANQSIQTDPLPIKMVSTSWDLIWNALGGNLALNITVSLHININEYAFFLNFTKNEVASKISF